MTKPLTYNATLLERVDLTGALSIFRVVPDSLPTKRPWFTAGQYCVVGLNNEEVPALGAVQRPMSIASAPEADGPIEFYIRRISKPVSHNPLTPSLWKLSAGDRLHMGSVAAGVFTIGDTVGVDDRRLRVMVAAGTGIAPFISMIRSEVCRNPGVDLTRWALLHGVSYPQELGYREELLALRAGHHLRYWGTVSRPDEAREWAGDVGRVESFFESERLLDLERRLGLPSGGFTPENAVVFICGLTGTIVGTVMRLIDRAFIPSGKKLRVALGVPAEMKDGVYFEDYDLDKPVIDVDDPQVRDRLRARVRAALGT